MKKRIICCLTVAVMLVCICACSLTAYAVGDVIDFTRDSLDLYLNQVYQLQLKSEAEGITYSSTDPNVVSVDNTGLVTSVSLGSSIIMATDKAGNQAACTVNVLSGTSPTEVRLETRSLTLTEGSSHALTATVLPSTVEDPRVHYYSSDESVARVDKNGNIKALKAGTAVITVESASAAVSSGCIVKVSSKSSDGHFSFSINGTLYTVSGEKKANMLVVLNKSGESFESKTDTEGRFSFDNIGQGNYSISVFKDAHSETPVASAQLSMGAHDMSLTCLLHDKELVLLYQNETTGSGSIRDITLEKANLSLEVGQSYDMIFRITPSSAALPTIKAASDNDRVAMVDSDNRITALAEGSAMITFTTSDGKFTKQCKVVVVSSTRNTYSWMIIAAESAILLLIVAVFFVSYRRFNRNKERAEGVYPPGKK